VSAKSYKMKVVAIQDSAKQHFGTFKQAWIYEL